LSLKKHGDSLAEIMDRANLVQKEADPNKGGWRSSLELADYMEVTPCRAGQVIRQNVRKGIWEVKKVRTGGVGGMMNFWREKK